MKAICKSNAALGGKMSIIIAVIALALFALTGCGSTEPTDSVYTTGPTPTTEVAIKEVVEVIEATPATTNVSTDEVSEDLGIIDLLKTTDDVSKGVKIGGKLIARSAFNDFNEYALMHTSYLTWLTFEGNSLKNLTDTTIDVVFADENEVYATVTSDPTELVTKNDYLNQYSALYTLCVSSDDGIPMDKPIMVVIVIGDKQNKNCVRIEYLDLAYELLFGDYGDYEEEYEVHPDDMIDGNVGYGEYEQMPETATTPGIYKIESYSEHSHQVLGYNLYSVPSAVRSYYGLLTSLHAINVLNPGDLTYGATIQSIGKIYKITDKNTAIYVLDVMVIEGNPNALGDYLGKLVDTAEAWGYDTDFN
jgi:hypothetical protein